MKKMKKYRVIKIGMSPFLEDEIEKNLNNNFKYGYTLKELVLNESMGNLLLILEKGE
jgi:hypothetical protein